MQSPCHRGSSELSSAQQQRTNYAGNRQCTVSQPKRPAQASLHGVHQLEKSVVFGRFVEELVGAGDRALVLVLGEGVVGENEDAGPRRISMLYALRARALARLCALAGTVLGLLGIVAFALPRTIVRNPLLDNPWLSDAAGYARIGVLTALVVVILGGALILLVPRPQRSPPRAVTLAAFASIASALALLIAFGAWSGSNLAAQSLQFAGDERVSSLVLLILGVTMK